MRRLGERHTAPHAGFERTVPSMDMDTGAMTWDATTHSRDTDTTLHGACIGRYVICEVLGRGGMGVVYRAYDPELNRSVALKLLRMDRMGITAERARGRLIREAQALAQLSHANVITVYDVGTCGDDVFVAMEMVEGRDLGAWLRAGKRSWREVVNVLAAAGRGLAAAHRAGLVHRDFKPENVMVGDDGRVRVLDFGLVRAAPAGTSPRELAAAFPAVFTSGEAAPPAPGSGLLAGSLTDCGAILGTPAYMAPEQHQGGDVDARADQFAFCVVLYRALYGALPFQGRSLQEIRAQVLAGRVAAPPGDTQVPRWLHRVMMRGLALAREARHPSMDALLAALAHGAGRRHRVLAGVAGLGIAAAACGLAWAAAGDQDPAAACRHGQERLAAVWNPARRQAVRAAFLATGRAHAAGTYERVARTLDEYGRGWTHARAEACEAARMRGTRRAQAAAALDLRLGCLSRRLQGLDVLVQSLATARGGAVVDAAIRAVHELPDVHECADVAALARAQPLPAAPARRAGIAAIELELDRARARLRLGQLDGAAELLAGIVARADATGHAPLRAQARYWLARAQEHAAADLADAEVNLLEAARLATDAGEDRLAAQAWLRLLWLQGERQARYDEALALQPMVEAALTRAGGAPDLRAELFGRVGALLMRMGRLEDAEELTARGLDRLLGHHGDAHHAVARQMRWLAATLREQGELDRAARYYERILDSAEKRYGPEHPWLVSPLLDYGSVLGAQGRHDRRLALYRRALAIEEANRGPETPHLAAILGELGLALHEIGHYREARQAVTRALAIERAVHGADHPRSGDTLRLMARILLAEGAYDQAEDCLRQVLALHQRDPGPEHPDYARGLLLLGRVASGRGQYADAAAHARRAAAILDATLGSAHPDTLAARVDVAMALSDQGDHRAAIAALDHIEAVQLAATGAAHPRYGELLMMRGAVELERGRHDVARELYTRGLGILDRARDASLPSRAHAFTGLARVHLARGDAAVALPLLEHALDIDREHPRDPVLAARIRFLLARALWHAAPDAGRDRERARDLAGEAHARTAGLAGKGMRLHRKITSWLARR